MDKMNISELGEEDTEQLFNNSQSFDEELEAETSELINEVFNTNYEPVYDPLFTKAEEQRYRHQKEEENKRNKYKLAHHHKVYQNLDDKELSTSFRSFLTRAQEKLDSHSHWVKKMKQGQFEKESRDLTLVPDILRGSRQKVQPIYQRCIDLQKQQQKKFEQKRINKHKTETKKIQCLTFRPSIKNAAKPRTFEEYFVEKEIWKQEKEGEVEKKRLRQEMKKLNECTFTPNLVAKYNKPNSRLVRGEKVEDRLLRSLQRSQQKYQDN